MNEQMALQNNQLGPLAYPTIEEGWTALVLAGQRPGLDPVAAHFGIEYKALVPMHGEAMLGRVVRALLQSPEIVRVLVLAQNVEEQLCDPQLAWLRGNAKVVPCVSGKSISGSVLSAITNQNLKWPVLVTTADNVMLTPATVSEFISAMDDQDVYVGLVERTRLETVCGPSKRTWLRFRDGAFTGANLFALHSPSAERLLRFWETVEQDRKSLLKLAARFGPVLLARVLTRSLTLEAALSAAGAKFGVRVKPVLLSDGRMGVDVDKPQDHTLAERLLNQQGEHAGPDKNLVAETWP